MVNPVQAVMAETREPQATAAPVAPVAREIQTPAGFRFSAALKRSSLKALPEPQDRHAFVPARIRIVSAKPEMRLALRINALWAKAKKVWQAPNPRQTY
jgi:hypothetical protein